MAAGVARPESSTSRILVIFAIILVGVIAWFVAPMFLPIWKWKNVDFQKIAKEKKVDVHQLMQEYTIVFRFEPRERRDDDPTPWQIVTSSPEWQSVDPDNRENEDRLLVRCYVLSDKSGEPPSNLYVGNTWKDRYFKAKCWRFPAGCFGRPGPPGRPILVYKSMTLEKVTIGEADMFETEIRKGQTNWENDDHWEDRDDGWDPREIDRLKKEAEEKAAEEAEAAGAPKQ